MKNKNYKLYILRSAFSALFCGIGYLGWQINSILEIIHNAVDTTLVGNENVVPDKKTQEPNYIEISGHKLVKYSSFIDRFWDNMTFSYARRLLNLAQNENKTFRLKSVENLASIKNLDDWHYSLLAHMCDARTAVALARTQNADRRFFIQPPGRFAFDDEYQLITWTKKFMYALNERCNHHCLSHFIKQQFINIQEIGHMVEHDISSANVTPFLKENENLLPLCMKSLLHHSSIENYAKDIVLLDGLPLLMEVYKHYKDRDDIVENIVQITSNISLYPELLHHVYKSGWIGELAKLTKSVNIRISGHAVKTLANFDFDTQDHGKYYRNVYLLHPIYRTNKQSDIDVVIVHGLLGGVFFTWRQRNCSMNPYEVTKSSQKNNVTKMATSSDPSTRKYISEIEQWNKLEWEETCKEYEVVFDDIPKNLDDEYSYSYSGEALTKDEDRQVSSCWPKDWLAKDCGNVRILGINYDTNLSLWAPICPIESLKKNTLEMRSKALLQELRNIGVGKKPIVWLTHSMGGLLVKQMLTEAWESQDERTQDICRNTKGIVFFSTPHKGSRVATLNQTTSLFLWPSVEVQELKQGSAALLQLHDKFIRMLNDNSIKICSFVETKSTVISPLKFNLHFVPEDSARMQIGEYHSVPLDHFHICKPLSRHSFLYQRVLSIIKEIVEEQNLVKEKN